MSGADEALASWLLFSRERPRHLIPMNAVFRACLHDPKPAACERSGHPRSRGCHDSRAQAQGADIDGRLRPAPPQKCWSRLQPEDGFVAELVRSSVAKSIAARNSHEFRYKRKAAYWNIGRVEIDEALVRKKRYRAPPFAVRPNE